MKNNKLIIDPIFDAIHTQEELEHLLLNLKDFSKVLLNTNREENVSDIFKQLPNSLATPIQEIWQNYQAENTDADPSSFLSEIEKILLNLERVNLSLAFQASQVQVESICDWLRSKLKNKGIIINIQFDPKLIAGCILEYRGKRYDLSVATQISNYVN